MTNIQYCRCDDRLIHGQVIHKWIDELNVHSIIVIDDKAYDDVVEKTFIQMAAPNHIQVHILNIAIAKSQYYKTDLMDQALVLVRNLETIQRLLHIGFHIDTLIIGRIPTGIGRKKVTSNVYLSYLEFEMLKNLCANKMNIFLQTIPDDKKIKFEDVVLENH